MIGCFIGLQITMQETHFKGNMDDEREEIELTHPPADRTHSGP